MATALIVDDEPLLREQLRGRLDTLWPELDRIDEAGDGFEAMAMIAGDAGIALPSVCFLDIHMPGPSGLEVAHRIHAMRRAGDAMPPEIVFITAYDAHAIEAFEHGAVDYLLKPFEPERLVETIARLKQRLAAPSQRIDSHASPDALMQLAERLAAIGSKPRPTLQWIKASIGSTVRLIPVEDVLYFHADDKYTRVITTDGEALIRKPIKELVTELDSARFWQIHRATIVNTRAIAGVVRGVKDSADLRLKNRPETLTVSRAYLHLFRQM
jgi:DNA-binding LytR/AlgR family response regulator